MLRQLYDEVVKPVAVKNTRGAWYRHWRLVSLDGSTLEVADEKANVEAFGRPGVSRGASAYPQIRFVALVENGTHVLFGARLGGCATGEITLAAEVTGALQKGMLCLADRNFFGFRLWNQARAEGRRSALAGEEESALAEWRSACRMVPTRAGSMPRSGTGGIKLTAWWCG